MSLFSLLLLFVSALLLSAALTFFLIPLLRRKRVGQTILAIGPAWHKPKEGTPTMGGLIFLFIIPLLTVLAVYLAEGSVPKTLIFVLIFAVSNGAIGWIDDQTKRIKKQNEGLLPWQKLFLQSLFTAGFFYLLLRFADLSPAITLPFSSVTVPFDFPLLFLFFVIVLGILNCVNLSDGIDGLTASSSLIIGVFFTVFGIQHATLSLAALGASLCGTMIGFLLFNRHPAKIFMGDTGSLFLGGLLSSAAFLTKKPSVLPIYSLLFLLEGGSVILQVLVFKRTGKRIFKMAPLHHHLEKCGWSENKIVLVFSLITMICCFFTFFALL